MDNKLKERKEPKWSVKGSYNISRCVYGYLQKGQRIQILVCLSI